MAIENKRNIAFLGHTQSGKTSLSESLLFSCGTSSRKGSVMEGNTLSDYSWDEIERKSSINSSLLHCNYEDISIQIIDTPGYIDFFGEVISSVRAVDNAVLIIDASSGVEVGTEKSWALLEELKLPRIIFVNKIDKEGLNKEAIISDIKSSLSSRIITLDSSTPEELMELVAESDDKLLEKYLAEEKLSPEEVASGLRKAVLEAKVFPLILGSALSSVGIDELLKSIKQYLASPLERAPLEVTGELKFSPDAAFSAFTFKSIFDPYVGQLSLLRIFSGRLAANSSFYNFTQKISERFTQIYLLQGKEQKNLEQAECGDIIAIPKLKQTHTQDSLGEEKHPLEFSAMLFPEPMISASVKPHSRQDEEKISQALNKLVAEDFTFKVSRGLQTNELIVSGLGDLHLDIMINRLKKRFNVQVDLGTPKVAYKETITRSAKVQGKYKRQSGGRGQYGDVHIEIKPLERGKEFEFVDKIVGGAIPRNFIPSVEKGIKQAMSEGVLAGYPFVDVQVTLFDGSYHDVDSSDMAFQIAGGMAFRKAVLEAGPALLEPIMDVEVAIPDEYLGQISGDLNSRHGRVMGMEMKGENQSLKAQVPLTQMFTYANDLRSITGGRGSYTMRFSHYEQVPAKTANEIIARYQEQKKKEQA
ncbi:MAG: elongation factor G [Candidatus Omnitrophica bacterium]|nr:elongation factor G [Candidatus Omnitrophota bacterium]